MRNYQIAHNGKQYDVSLLDRQDDSITFLLDGQQHTVAIAPQLISKGAISQTPIAPVSSSSSPSPTGKPGEVLSPIPGVIVKITVETGQKVEVGDNLLVIEAMKMENNLPSPSAGTVGEILVSEGDEVENNQLLIKLT